MKRTAMVLVPLLALVASAHAADSHGFTIAMPDGWVEADLPPNVSFAAVDNRPTGFRPTMLVSFERFSASDAAPVSFYASVLEKAGLREVVSSVAFTSHHGAAIRRMQFSVLADDERRRMYFYLLPRGGVTATVVFMCAEAEADALLPTFEATIERFGGIQTARPATVAMSRGDAIAFRLGQTIAYALLALFALFCAIKIQKWMKL